MSAFLILVGLIVAVVGAVAGYALNRPDSLKRMTWRWIMWIALFLVQSGYNVLSLRRHEWFWLAVGLTGCYIVLGRVSDYWHRMEKWRAAERLIKAAYGKDAR